MGHRLQRRPGALPGVHLAEGWQNAQRHDVARGRRQSPSWTHGAQAQIVWWLALGICVYVPCLCLTVLGCEQRCAAAAHAWVSGCGQPGAVLDEERNHRRVTILSCFFQRRIIFGTHVCTVPDEELHNVCVTILGCAYQRTIIRSMHVCAVLDEKRHHIIMAISRGTSQSTLVAGMHFSTEKQLDSLDVPVLGSSSQRQIPISARMCFAGRFVKRFVKWRAVLIDASTRESRESNHARKDCKSRPRDPPPQSDLLPGLVVSHQP